MTSVQYNAIGVSIILTARDAAGAVMDLSGATLDDALLLRNAANRLKTKTPDFVTDGSDGQIVYVTEDGDLDEVGAWRAQYRYLEGSDDIPSTVLQFVVQANIFP